MRALIPFGVALLLFLTFSSGCRPPDQPPPPVPVPLRPRLDGLYEGSWLTTKSWQLDGTMQCVVTETGEGQWHGVFSGIWRGRRWTYNVDWVGQPDSLHGVAEIDGASYTWTGSISGSRFRGSFAGSRYTGSFDLTKK